jgi:hypothetical protein
LGRDSTSATRPSTTTSSAQNSARIVWFEPVTGSELTPLLNGSVAAGCTVVVVAPAEATNVEVVVAAAVVDVLVAARGAVVVVARATVVVVAAVVVVVAATTTVVDVAATVVDVPATVVDVVPSTSVVLVVPSRSVVVVVPPTGGIVVVVVPSTGGIVVVVVPSTGGIVVVVVVVGVTLPLVHVNCDGPPAGSDATTKSVTQNFSVTPAFVHAMPILYDPAANVPTGYCAKFNVDVPMIWPFGSVPNNLFTCGEPPIADNNGNATAPAGATGPPAVYVNVPGSTDADVMYPCHRYPSVDESPGHTFPGGAMSNVNAVELFPDAGANTIPVAAGEPGGNARTIEVTTPPTPSNATAASPSPTLFFIPTTPRDLAHRSR